jgi:hypothetical protein
MGSNPQPSKHKPAPATHGQRYAVEHKAMSLRLNRYQQDRKR